MKKLLTLLLIPAVLTANMNVNIIVSREESIRSSQVSGSEKNVIDNVELESFQLYDGKLKDAIKDYFGKKPDDVYVKSRTPWGDLFVTYGWNPVNRVIKAVNIEITKAYYVVDDIMKIQVNNTDLTDVVKKVNVSKEVQHTVTSTWPQYGELAGVIIHYDINIADAIKNGTSFNFDSNWGDAVNQSQLVTVGPDHELEVPLKPGQRAKVVTKATKGVWRVKVYYEATISGNIAINYNVPFKGHHFYSMDVAAVLDAGRLSPTVNFSEEIIINYYRDYQVEIQDVDTKEMISS